MQTRRLHLICHGLAAALVLPVGLARAQTFNRILEIGTPPNDYKLAATLTLTNITRAKHAISGSITPPTSCGGGAIDSSQSTLAKSKLLIAFSFTGNIACQGQSGTLLGWMNPRKGTAAGTYSSDFPAEPFVIKP